MYLLAHVVADKDIGTDERIEELSEPGCQGMGPDLGAANFHKAKDKKHHQFLCPNAYSPKYFHQCVRPKVN